MASNDDHKDDGQALDALAGEYVLGTLDVAERVSVEARLQREPALAAAIDGWATRLAPLDIAVAPAPPPEGQLDAIMQHIDQADGTRSGGADNAAAEIIQLKRRASRWRFASLATGAIAAALAFLMVFGIVPGRNLPGGSGAGPQMVALLESKDAKLAYVASINTKSGKISLKRLGAQAPSGKSHELWAIGGGREKPESLGVINANAELPVGTRYFGGVTLAVSLEPPGGSPTGQPTGPVLFTGKCVYLPEV